MTNLKKEITITLKTVEEAVLCWHIMNASALRSIEEYSRDRVDAKEGLDFAALVDYKSALWEDINTALYAQNINPHNPPKGKLAAIDEVNLGEDKKQ
ncbi:MAG: hypothetical protein WC998_03480 [Candidatus Paceibacterota bacterium]|jgi:hypothetical protein